MVAGFALFLASGGTPAGILPAAYFVAINGPILLNGMI